MASTYSTLLEKLEIKKIEDQGVEIDLVSVIGLAYNCINMHTASLQALFVVFKGLFSKALAIKHVLFVLYSMVQEEDDQFFKNMPTIILMLLSKLSSKKEENVIDAKKYKTVKAISEWMEAIMFLLDKENAQDSDKKEVYER